ncbi:MAG TPA: hypothetical protein VFA32_01705, partial [Dehalococcoidia bacterium]|nr:hypothetical protein [Dehalococcoidia bacterium]
MTTRAAESSPENGESPLYYISFERLDELHRSAVAVLAARRGPSSPSRLKPDNELSDPQELVDEIAEHDAREQDFIHPNMPIQEIVFRILLARRNQPTQLSDLHYELTEKWATPIRPINVTAAGLRRVLDSDTYYGFAQQD